jgi:hypothetical protein
MPINGPKVTLLKEKKEVNILKSLILSSGILKSIGTNIY